jgi:transcriptional regulator with XRE-family HTH domain
MTEPFPTRLRRLRGTLSQQKLAEILRASGHPRVSGQWISQVERGSANAGRDLQKLVDDILAKRDPHAYLASILASQEDGHIAPAHPKEDLASQWAAKIITKIVAAASRGLWLTSSQENSSLVVKGKQKAQIPTTEVLMQFLHKAIQARHSRTAENRPISMLFQNDLPLDSEEVRQQFLDFVVAAVKSNWRLIYATVESADQIARAFDDSHFALKLEAAVAATFAEAHFWKRRAHTTKHQRQRPTTLLCRSFGSSQLGVDRRSQPRYPETIVGINVVAVPNNGILVTLPSPTITKSQTSFFSSAASDDVKRAIGEFEQSLEYHDEHISVYPRDYDDEFWAKYADIEAVHGERNLVQKFFSTVTRPISFFDREGEWFTDLVKIVEDDKERAERIATSRYLRAARINDSFRRGTSYRQICDLVTIEKWLETGERSDIPMHPSREEPFRDNKEGRLQRLNEVENLLADSDIKFEIAFVENFDQLIYGGSYHELRHGWIVIGPEHTIVEVNCDHDKKIQEIRVILKNESVAKAFAGWFRECWDQIPAHHRERRKNLELVRGWIKRVKSQQSD